ncbi:hypothetical protein EXIGLDRAFT_733842 [Exidia glandulosa HHB12029]|uniref:Uncharacterized protein n=1 Tax=Exidia glandulosa HHB12029 TaxID=1314781 RepID=A0A165B767_EXIGL|nr:hypothetical protein EXIGLDRAFT_733842 [Exidia glandulosa HHB12029]
MSLTFSGSAIEVYAPPQNIEGYFLMDGASTTGGLQATPQEMPGCVLMISWSNLDPGTHHTLTLSTLHGPTPGFPMYSPQMVINYVRYDAPEPVPSMPPVDVPSQTVTPGPPSSSPTTTSPSPKSPSISTTVLHPSNSSVSTQISTSRISPSTPPQSNPLSLSVTSPSVHPDSQTTPAHSSSTTPAVALGGSTSGSPLKVVLASTAGGTLLLSAIGVGAVLLYRRRRLRHPQRPQLAPKGSLRAYPVLPPPPTSHRVVLRDVRVEKLDALFHETEKGESLIPSPVYKS